MKNKTVPYPSDFKSKNSTPEKIAEFHLGMLGKMVGGSKSIYRYDNPSNYVIFNSNLATKKHGKIWYGDIDLTKSLKVLRELAEDLKEDIFVFYEADGRFGKENDLDYSKAAIEIHSHDGRTLVRHNEYVYFDKKGDLRVKTQEEISAEEKVVTNPKIYDESNYEAIELPDLKTIKISKKNDPLGQFQQYFIEKYGKEQAIGKYRRLWVTRSYYEELEKLSTKFAKKMYPGLHPVKIEQSVAMYMLDMSPMSFQDDQPWEKKNTGYLKKEVDE